MVVLVSGASGFIGSKLLKSFAESDFKIYAIYNTSEPKGPLASTKNIEWIKADISKDTIDISKFENLNATIHLAGATLGAGTKEDVHFKSNELSTFNLLQSVSNNCKNFIFSSSQVVYGNPSSLSINENFPLDGSMSPYASSKINCENWLRWFQAKTNGTYISLRSCGFIDGGGVIDYIIERAIKNKDIELYNNGKIIRDYIDSNDFINAINNTLISLEKMKEKFTPINIGSSQTITALEIAKLIVDVLNSKSNIIQLKQSAPLNNFVMDIKKAKNLIKYDPSDLSEAIKAYAVKKIDNE